MWNRCVFEVPAWAGETGTSFPSSAANPCGADTRMQLILLITEPNEGKDTSISSLEENGQYRIRPLDNEERCPLYSRSVHMCVRMWVLAKVAVAGTAGNLVGPGTWFWSRR